MALSQGPDDPDAAVARAVAGVYGPAGVFRGSAVAVHEPAYGTFLITCAHVVNLALGRKMEASDTPDVRGLRFEFQAAANGARQVVDEVKLLMWSPRGKDLSAGLMWEGDLAVLGIAGSPPPEIGVVPMADHRVGAEVYSWYGAAPVALVTAKVDSVSPPWLTLNTVDSSMQFESGYSGGAVWDRGQQAVVGVVVGKMDGPGRGYALPVSAFRALIREREALVEGDYAQWRELARGHFAGWAALDAGAAVEDAVVGLVGRLAAYCFAAKAAGGSTVDPVSGADPWRSQRLAGWMSKLLGDLVGSARVAFHDTEKVLLVLAPFLHAAGWEAVLAAARVEGREADLERFRGQFPALVEKQNSATLRGNAMVARTVERWLWRKWAVSSPGRDAAVAEMVTVGIGVGSGDAFTGLEHPARRILGEALRPEVVCGLFTMMAAQPSATAVLGPVPGGLGGPVLRCDLVARLVTVAQLMAVDPMQVAGVCEHLTVRGDYGVAELRDLTPTWSSLDVGGTTGTGPGTTGDTVAACTLDVECHAVETEALLRAHCAVLDDYVMQIRHGDPILRAILPVRFASVRLRAATRADGTPEYLFSDTRFSLDDDLMRDLLMGDRLYGNPSLAYRELFQNALDACRYRDKQAEYLEKVEHDTTARQDWHGKIVFTRGIEDGREYVECRDTGVGMGREEIQHLFARGGARFVTSLRYLKERAEWEKAGIEFHPNSRFGIGVFSYFMLADEMRVTTTRHWPDRPTEHLQVDIAGPAAPLRITKLRRGPSAVGGTAVRLFLKPGLRAERFTETLRRLVWYCEYPIEARYDDEDVFRLEAGALSEHAAIGRSNAEGNPIRHSGVRTDAGSEPGVWWCTGWGAALSDGVVINHDVYGAVVNLTGASAPKLTVDRKNPQHRDSVNAEVDRILLRNLTPLVEESGTVLSPGWLSSFPDLRQDCADAVMRALAATGRSWWMFEGGPEAARVGCLREEARLLNENWSDVGKNLIRQWRKWPPAISSSRLRAWAETAGVDFPPLRWVEPDRPLPLALPSDNLLLDSGHLPARSDRVPLGHVLSASRQLGRSPTVVLERLRELGLLAEDLPSGLAHNDSPGKHFHVILLSRGGDGNPPWVADGSEIDAARTIPLAAHLRVEPEVVEDHYRILGFSPTPRLPGPLPSGWQSEVKAVDRALRGGRVSSYEDSPLVAGRILTPDHLIEAASQLGVDVDGLWDRLRTMGLPVPTPDGPVTLGSVDVLNPMSRYCRVCGRWIREEAAPYVHRLHGTGGADGAAVHQYFRLPEPGGEPVTPWMLGKHGNVDVLQALEKLGFDVSQIRRGRTAADVAVLAELESSSSGPELSSAHVTIATLIYGGRRVKERLTDLGYSVPDVPHPEVSPDDQEILANLNLRLRRSRYLSPSRVVPWERVLSIAARTRRPVCDVGDRLTALGFEVEDLGIDPDLAESEDGFLVSHDATGSARWPRRGPVPLVDLVDLSLQTGRTLPDIASRLALYGYELPTEVDLTPDD